MSNSSLKVFISTGELSGDLHASRLIRELRQNPSFPPIELTAVGSTNLQAEGAELLYDCTDLSFLGVLANLPSVPKAYQRFRHVLKHILDRRVDLVILVDYRFFNLALARALRRRGFNGVIAYYIVPTLWQSAFDDRFKNIKNAPQKFINKIAKRYLVLKDCCDISIAIYPISLELLDFFGVSYIYVGHPQCQMAEPEIKREEFLKQVNLSEGKLVGVMPGSRMAEVAVIGRELARAVKILQEKFHDLSFVVPIAHPSLENELRRQFAKQGSEVTFIDAKLRYALISHSDLMLVSSGTAVHECAVMGVPHVIVYKLPLLHDFIYSTFTRFRLPYYGFTNLVWGEEIVPELIRSECNGERIASIASSLLENADELNSLKEKLKLLKDKICKPEPIKNTCNAILEVLSRKGIIS